MDQSIARILCVDDEPLNLRLLEAMLSPRGYDVITAANGPKALAKIAAEKVDICLLDVLMPGMDGFEVCRRIKSDNRYRTIPVMMITSHADRQNRILGIEAGAEDFISKPFDSAEVLARIKMLLQVKSLHEQLQSAHDKLETANIELEAFNYSVSHDLRSPLTVISGFCQVIQNIYGNSFDEQCRGYLLAIHEGTLSMNRLINTLLEFSHITRVEMRHDKIDLSRTAEEVALRLKVAAPERQVTFCITPGVTTYGDTSLLRVVMNNLIGNAWKFTGNRDGAVIEIGVMEIEGEPVCFVRDNGLGFDMTYADKMFIPFQRISGTEVEGHGIGLATVDRIIRRHGGRVWAEGEPEKGATFYFTLKDKDER